MTYDSAPDTVKHIERVRELMRQIVDDLEERLLKHDASKLEDPEKAIFDEFTPKLEQCEYMSDEYRRYLREMHPALVHHYEKNRHHPQFFENGVEGMNLIDMIEMLADWKAAGERHGDHAGGLAKSIETNQKRFGYSDSIRLLLHRTAQDLGWG